MRQLGCNQRMASLMVSRDLFLIFGKQQGLALRAHHYLVFGQLKVVHGDRLAIIAGRQQGRLVHHVGEVRTGKSGSTTGQNVQFHIVG